MRSALGSCEQVAFNEGTAFIEPKLAALEMNDGTTPGPPPVEALEAKAAADAAEIAENAPAETDRGLVAKTDAQHQAGNGISAESPGHRRHDPGGAVGNPQVTARGEGEAAAGVAEIHCGSEGVPMEAAQQGSGTENMPTDNQEATIVLRATPRCVDEAADLGQTAVDRRRLMRVQNAAVTSDRGFQFHAVKKQDLGRIGGIGSAVSGCPRLGDAERGAKIAA